MPGIVEHGLYAVYANSNGAIDLDSVTFRNNNYAINVIAAGNTAVFSPHPAGARIAARALQMFNREIQAATGVQQYRKLTGPGAVLV